MNLTPLVRTFFSRRVAAIDSYADHAEQLQRTVLAATKILPRACPSPTTKR